MLHSLICLLLSFQLASTASVAVSSSPLVTTITSTYLSTTRSIVSTSVSMTTFGNCSPTTKSGGQTTSVCISGASATAIPVYNSSVVTITTKLVSTIGYSTIYSYSPDSTTISSTISTVSSIPPSTISSVPSSAISSILPSTISTTATSYIPVTETFLSVLVVSTDDGGVLTASTITTLVTQTSSYPTITSYPTLVAPAPTAGIVLTSANSSPTDNASSAAPESGSKLSKDSIVKIAVAVGVILGVIFTCCFTFLVVKRRRDQRQTQFAPEYDQPYGYADHMAFGNPKDVVVTTVKPAASTDSVWTNSPPTPPTRSMPSAPSAPPTVPVLSVPQMTTALAVPIAKIDGKSEVKTSATVSPGEMQEMSAFAMYGTAVSPPQSPIESKQSSPRLADFANANGENKGVDVPEYDIDGRPLHEIRGDIHPRHEAYGHERYEANSNVYYEAQSNPRFELSARNSAYLQAQQHQRENAQRSQTYEGSDAVRHEVPSNKFHEPDENPTYSVRGNAFSEVQRNARNSGHGAVRFEMAAVPARHSGNLSYLPPNLTRYRG